MSDAGGLAMSKTAIVLTFGAMSALLGILLALKANELATHWEALGPGTWGGTTNPAIVRDYEVIGICFMAFGLALAVLAVQRWLARGVSTNNVQSPA